jgi:hypothetical protein
MTHDQLIQAERAATQAFRAARVFADKDTCKQFNRVEYILAEIRHCGMWLCDPESDQYEAAKTRLAELFQTEWA